MNAPTNTHPDAGLIAIVDLWLGHHKAVREEANPEDNSATLLAWQATNELLHTLRPKTLLGVLALAIVAKDYAQVPGGKAEYPEASKAMAWAVVNDLIRLAA